MTVRARSSKILRQLIFKYAKDGDVGLSPKLVIKMKKNKTKQKLFTQLFEFQSSHKRSEVYLLLR